MRQKTILIFRVMIVFALITNLFSAVLPVMAAGQTQKNADNTDTGSGGNQIYLPLVSSPNTASSKSWPTVGANAERTSWTAEEVDGAVKPLWYKQFEPYIDPKTQIITAYSTLYISTAAGLYALDANTGATKWIYPTEMPLGHSPAISDGVAYVGGLDRRLHAINAITGQGLWKFTAGDGFTTSPLVVNGMVYIGNRDGYFYAIYASGSFAGQLAWKFKTDGTIDFSAAYKDGIIYFASNDSYAYALNTQGNLVWKSAKLPGAGFHSWWPVVYRDWVIFAGSQNYRAELTTTEVVGDLFDVDPHFKSDPKGTLIGPLGHQPGDWVTGTYTIDTSLPNVTSNGQTVPVTEYLENKPWRRTFFVLNRFTGKEYTTDFDHDGKPEYAPILWQGTQSGNRFPPVVGIDGVLYTAMWYMSSPYIAGGQVVGWKIGTPYISIASGSWKASDEPLAYAVGGQRIYWNLCCDRESGSFDITVPKRPLYGYGSLDEPASTNNTAIDPELTYFSYNLDAKIPGYGTRYYPNSEGWSTFGGRNGVYGPHGDQNPPIPYQGKLFMHRSNAILAFSPDAGTPTRLQTAATVVVNDPTIPAPTTDQVRARLAGEIEKMLNAGHLRPAYISNGVVSYQANMSYFGDNLEDYWSNPADTLYVLCRALPYLSLDQQNRVKTYLKAEFSAYPPYQFTNIGWNGAARAPYELPPEVVTYMSKHPAHLGSNGYQGWDFAPYAFYAMWKYAEIFPADARNIFDASKNLLGATPPADSYLIANPQAMNAYIAGYKGYYELQALAYPGTPVNTAMQNQYNRLLSLRAANFSKDGPVVDPNNPINYLRSLNVSRNFLYLVPELGQYLHDNARDKVQAAVNEYSQVAPNWFVANFGAVFGEGATEHLYDSHALFQARALILQEPRQDLAQYLDTPAVAIGDLFYIDNLISAIQAEGR